MFVRPCFDLVKVYLNLSTYIFKSALSQHYHSTNTALSQNSLSSFSKNSVLPESEILCVVFKETHTRPRNTNKTGSRAKTSRRTMEKLIVQIRKCFHLRTEVITLLPSLISFSICLRSSSCCCIFDKQLIGLSIVIKKTSTPFQSSFNQHFNILIVLKFIVT